MPATNIAEKMQDDLEAHGEYVVRANASWFAIFLNTWNRRLELAVQAGRIGPNLIVYRTRSGDPRDFHVLPYQLIANLLTEITITHSRVNGSSRWNLTLTGDMLHVSHRSGLIDVAEYRSRKLLTEEDVSKALDEPTTMDFQWEVGEGRMLSRLHRKRERNKEAVRRKKHAVLAETGYLSCEVCSFDFGAFYGPLGEGFAECHHLTPLASLDPAATTKTRSSDLAIVCANCHRMLHRRPLLSIAQLRAVVAKYHVVAVLD